MENFIFCALESDALWRLTPSVAKPWKTMNSVMIELTKLQRLVILISFPSDKIVRLAVVKWIIIIQTGFNRLVYYLAIRKPLLNDKVGWGKQQRSILINNFDRETFYVQQTFFQLKPVFEPPFSLWYGKEGSWNNEYKFKVSHTSLLLYKKKHNKPRDLTQAIPCKPLEIFSRSFLVCISVNVAAECSTTIMKKYAGVSLNSTIKHYWNITYP